MEIFFGKVIIPTVLLLAIILFSTWLFPQITLWHSTKWFMMAFFTFLSFFNYSIYEIGLKNYRIKFQNFFFLSTFVRLIAAVIFIFIFIQQKITNLPIFIVNFFIFYFFYLGFEIYFLWGNLRADSK